jgi:ABC-type sugar transport system substrate-binding protein
MRGKGRAVLMVGAMLLLAGFAAPSQAAVNAGNILAAPATVDNDFRQELRVQMAAADARAGTAKPAVDTGAPAQAPQSGQAQSADGQVVASDQLNDVDRALHEPTPSAQPVALASNDAPAPRVVVMAGSDHSLWDQTSLIGKVFIAFGMMLTVGSAARMFMA